MSRAQRLRGGGRAGWAPVVKTSHPRTPEFSSFLLPQDHLPAPGRGRGSSRSTWPVRSGPSSRYMWSGSRSHPRASSPAGSGCRTRTASGRSGLVALRLQGREDLRLGEAGVQVLKPGPYEAGQPSGSPLPEGHSPALCLADTRPAEGASRAVTPGPSPATRAPCSLPLGWRIPSSSVCGGLYWLPLALHHLPPSPSAARAGRQGPGRAAQPAYSLQHARPAPQHDALAAGAGRMRTEPRTCSPPRLEQLHAWAILCTLWGQTGCE